MTYFIYDELFRSPLCGVGESQGESVSATIFSKPIAATTSLVFLAFLNVSTPPIPI